MITIKNIRLNDAKNKTFIEFEDSISFRDNSIYFIIGRSGVGKTSLVDFLTAPFTDDPIKNGEIELSPELTLELNESNEIITNLTIRNSFNRYSKKYVNFIRKSVAYIPQKTDSLHPSIPVVDQMYKYYQMALPEGKKPNENEFNNLLAKLSLVAGWKSITRCPQNERCLRVIDEEDYIDENTNKPFMGKIKNNRNANNEGIQKTYESEFSSGQLQRLLILMGLIQFHISDHPILVGDEFLVNFSYLKSNIVLENVIKYFFDEQKKFKTAIFILHDLSFDFLKNKFLKKIPPGFSAKIIGIEDIGVNKKNIILEKMNINPLSHWLKKKIAEFKETESKYCQKLIKHEINVAEFFEKKWNNNPGEEFFKEFHDSYEIRALTSDECKLSIQYSDEEYRFKIDINEDDCPYNDIRVFDKKINLSLKKNRVIVLTGFSGCGKSTLCKVYVEKNIKEKKTVRFFPDKPLSSLSEDSQVSIREDLEIMYNYYNKIENLKNESLKSNIKELLESVRFYRETDEIDADEFLSRKIYDLSGGQQQRYWLARLLFDYDKASDGVFVQPELFILDESIASLDCITKNSIISYLLQKVFSGKGATLLLISHDLRDIGVIYETLLEEAGEENIDKVFEHYEMLDGNLFGVKENFTDYRNNLISEKGNNYLAIPPSEKNLFLRANKATRSEDKTEDKNEN